MELHRPPFGTNAELIEYFDRQFRAVEEEINALKSVVVLKAFPPRPRTGKIYNIEGELYYYNSSWFKLLHEPHTPQEFIHGI